jgi:hypothetical protein
MARLVYVLILFAVLLPTFLFPAFTHADGCLLMITLADTTLPVTDIGSTAAVLNGTTYVTEKVARNFQKPAQDGSSVPQVFEYGTTPGVYPNRVDAEEVFDSITLTNNGNFVLLQETVTWRALVQGLNPCTTYYVRLRAIDEIVFSGANSTNKAAAKIIGKSVAADDPCIEIARAGAVTFTTDGCNIRTGQGGPVSNGTTTLTISGPVQMSSVAVQSAAIVSSRVSPGENVDVAAFVANKGTSNGDAKVTLYVNGEEVESRGVTVSSGQTTPVHFYFSRNEPGTYSVFVNGVRAGNFTVDMFANNEILIYGIMALFALGIAGTLYLVTKNRAH